MRTTLRLRNRCLAATLCAAAIAFTGCGRSHTAALPASDGNSSGANRKFPEAALDQQTDQKLDPLTKEDVELYLKVMRAAAERVKNPEAQDRASLESAKKILAASTAGRVPKPDDVKTLERANLVAMYMDQIVAEQMKIDGRTYRGIAEAIESVVPNPAATGGGSRNPAAGSGASYKDAPAPDPSPAPNPGLSPGLSPLEQRLRDVDSANRASLRPYLQEITALIAIVHNPANLPN